MNHQFYPQGQSPNFGEYYPRQNQAMPPHNQQTQRSQHPFAGSESGPMPTQRFPGQQQPGAGAYPNHQQQQMSGRFPPHQQQQQTGRFPPHQQQPSLMGNMDMSKLIPKFDQQQLPQFNLPQNQGQQMQQPNQMMGQRFPGSMNQPNQVGAPAQPQRQMQQPPQMHQFGRPTSQPNIANQITGGQMRMPNMQGMPTGAPQGLPQVPSQATPQTAGVNPQAMQQRQPQSMNPMAFGQFPGSPLSSSPFMSSPQQTGNQMGPSQIGNQMRPQMAGNQMIPQQLGGNQLAGLQGLQNRGIPQNQMQVPSGRWGSMGPQSGMGMMSSPFDGMSRGFGGSSPFGGMSMGNPFSSMGSGIGKDNFMNGGFGRMGGNSSPFGSSPFGSSPFGSMGRGMSGMGGMGGMGGLSMSPGAGMSMGSPFSMGGMF